MSNPYCRRALTILFVCLAVLASAACATAAGAGAGPHRIVSLSPGITEILFALGLGSRVVGDTDYCDYPPEAKTLQHIGGIEINYEAVVGLRPDLVIADKLANEQSIPRLRALRLNCLLIEAESLPGIDQTIDSIADVCRAEPAAHRLIAQIRLEQSKAIEVASQHTGPALRVLVIAGTSPLYAAGSDTFVGDMIGELGAVNVAGKTGFSPLSKEVAIAKNPQVVICGSDDAAAISTDPAWSATFAVRHHNLLAIDPNLIFRPGPRLPLGMIQIAEDLARARQ